MRDKIDDDDDKLPADPNSANRYRSASMRRAPYLAQDRPDLQCSTRELDRSLQNLLERQLNTTDSFPVNADHSAQCWAVILPGRSWLDRTVGIAIASQRGFG